MNRFSFEVAELAFMAYVLSQVSLLSLCSRVRNLAFTFAKLSLPVERLFVFAVVYVVRGFVRFDGFRYALLPRGALEQILHSCGPSAYARE